VISVYDNDKCNGPSEVKMTFAGDQWYVAACGSHSLAQDGRLYYYYKDDWGACKLSYDVGNVFEYVKIGSWNDKSKEGDWCMAKWDSDPLFGICAESWGGTPDYRFDTEEKGCVHCSGKKQDKIHYCSSGPKDVEPKCEEACGADPNCDEVIPGTSCCSSDCYNLDLNGKGTIDIIDISNIALAFSSKPGGYRWNSKADVNHDGVVDITDITIMAIAWGQSCKGTVKLGVGSFSIIVVLITIVLIVLIFGFFKVFVKRM
jgi:hypothetical protein